VYCCLLPGAICWYCWLCQHEAGDLFGSLYNEFVAMSSPPILFDLDGTLLDTLDDLAFAGNQALEQCGHPVHPVEKYRYFVGDGLATLIDRITPSSAGEEEKTQCFDLFRSIYSQCWHDRTRPYDGITAMLATVKQAGRRLCILSNKPHDFTLLCVSHFFDDDVFELVLGQREGVAKKPHPAGALEIAQRMGVAPGSCLYVGDTRVDMETGKSAGMFTIGVLWGFRDSAELQENGADVLVQTPDELARIVLSM